MKHFIRYISIFLLACSQFILFSGVQYKLYPTDIVSSKAVYKSAEENQNFFYTLEEESFGEEDENESASQFKQTDGNNFVVKKKADFKPLTSYPRDPKILIEVGGPDFISNSNDCAKKILPELLQEASSW